jgi:signal transduction histidine kinase
VRDRLLLASFLMVFVAVVLLGVPLAVLGIQHVRDEARDRLGREAQAVAALLAGDDGENRALPIARLRALLSPHHAVLITEEHGLQTTIGRPPGGERVEATAAAGPDTRVTVLAPAGELNNGVDGVLVVVGLSALGSLAAALGLGWWLARRFARPLEALAAASRRLGRGDFGVRAGRYSLPEIDAVAAALDRSAERLGMLVARERAFSANVSHQLRTPVTALRLRLEELLQSPEAATRAEAGAGLAQADRLERTIEDLLVLARHGRAGEVESLDLAAVLRDRARAWAPAFRRRHRSLQVSSPSRAEVQSVRGAVEQALDVLLENALEHGGGTVSASVRLGDGHAVLAVSDTGPGIAPGAESGLFERESGGLGLRLARALVEAADGRLRLAEGRPPTFEIVLPVALPRA